MYLFGSKPGVPTGIATSMVSSVSEIVAAVTTMKFPTRLDAQRI